MPLHSMYDNENLVKTFKEFAYVVSHDLGTPLRAMVEFSKLLKAENAELLGEESKLYLSMIIENGEKAQCMLHALLEYSRLNTAAKPYSDTDCAVLWRQCQSDLAGKISACKAVVRSEPLPSLMADNEQMKQLFTVLLDNALTFHSQRASPMVALSARQQGGDWIFTVRDNGIGIDMKFHDRIFQPFKRLHAEGEYPGVGMGLTLAKKIVDRHHGRIWVDSIPGEGSAFQFSIPKRKA